MVERCWRRRTVLTMRWERLRRLATTDWMQTLRLGTRRAIGAEVRGRTPVTLFYPKVFRKQNLGLDLQDGVRTRVRSL